MRVHIGGDHAAYELHQELVTFLESEGHEVTDHGPFDLDPQDDYPVFVLRAAEGVAADPGSFGIVLGGSGNGEQMAANKVTGIRAALANNVELARLTREHNDANIIALGGRMQSLEAGYELVATFLAWEQNNTILGLVAFAWAGFGASFGPIVILSLFWRKLTNLGAITGMLLGAVTVFAWTVTPWADLYEIIPGFLVSLVSAVLVSKATYRRDEEIEREFDDAVRLAHAAEDEMAAR